MGLFSKKTLVCEECGREYETRVALGAKLCPDCQARKKELLEQVQGYMDYRLDAALFDPLTSEDMKQIVERRTDILEKNRLEAPISEEELRHLGSNYSGLSDEECADILRRVNQESIQDVSIGSALTEGMLFPSQFDNVIVSAEDVFAVAYVTSQKASRLADLAGTCQNPILCAIFTNDPYVPILPYLMIGEMGFFSWHSKEGRVRAEERFTRMCPNLTYPVCALKELKKTIKTEGKVRGNLDMDYMLERISDAELDSGIFNAKKFIKLDANAATIQTLEQYGYVRFTKIVKYLGLDNKMFGTFWKKKIEKLR